MKILLYLAVLFAGAVNSIQAGCNGALNKAFGNPFAAGLVVLAVSAISIALTGAAIGRISFPGTAQIASTPWWAWFGGVFGSTMLLSQMIVAKQVGAAPFMALIVTSSVIAALALDHFGMVGFEVHAVSAGRVFGALLMITGVTLIALF